MKKLFLLSFFLISLTTFAQHRYVIKASSGNVLQIPIKDMNTFSIKNDSLSTEKTLHRFKTIIKIDEIIIRIKTKQED